MKTVVIIGGGPAGMMAGIVSARNKNRVILLEKNEKLGKKLFITGKGRCNLTNNSSNENVINNTVTNGKFLYSALNVFSPENTIEFFESIGLKLKTERGNRVFPESDKSSDVIKVLQKELVKLDVDIRFNSTVEKILVENGKIIGVACNNSVINADSVVIATGGVSYPLTGSTGDGYKFARELGHNVIKPTASLVGITTNNVGIFAKNFTLKNVVLSAKASSKVLYSELGEVMLTEYGLAGPLTLTASALLNKKSLSDIDFYIDFKPALDNEKLENRILRDIEELKTANLYTLVNKLVPSFIASAILTQSNLSKNKSVSNITANDRRILINTIKNFKIKPLRFRPIDEAIVTSGGVLTKEILPSTMESKLIDGLYFAGEIIDVDAFTGGYNIQIALSTGYLAGLNA